MPKIPDDEIERVKREVPVERLVRAAGVELRAHGGNLLGLCPMHDDREPSLVVTPAKNLWHCMGACQTGGDVFAWVMKREGVTFPGAYRRLLEECGPPPEDTITSPLTPSMTDEELMRAIVGYYLERGKERREFQSYLQTRGIDDREMIERFQIGYAPQHPGLKLPTGLSVRETRVLRERLGRLGIARAPRGHEHFAGSMTVPVFDERGNVAEIYGRKTRDDLKKGTVYHLYLPGPHRGVWNLEALRESKEIILCEAAIDALTFWRHGFQNVTWSYGTQGFTREHLDAFKAYGTSRVLIAYDRDEPGDRAAQKLAERLIAEGISAYRVDLPRGFDVNEYALKMSPAHECSTPMGIACGHLWAILGAASGSRGLVVGKRGSDLEPSASL
jgi:DNA primase